MGLTALDLGVRGATSGLFLMILLVLLNLRPSNAKIRLGAAMAGGGAAYAIATAPFVPKSWMAAMPLLVANPVIFWLWARATFDDDFVLMVRHGMVWLATVGAGYLIFLGWPLWPNLAAVGAKCLSLAAVAFAIFAAAQTVQTWREDLIAGRRRLRIVVLAFNV
ncbi:MAG: AraC family transcriptional regulator, partial [Tardiphaga sp.]